MKPAMQWNKSWDNAFSSVLRKFDKKEKETISVIVYLNGDEGKRTWKVVISVFALSYSMLIAVMKLKDAFSLEGKLWPT